MKPARDPNEPIRPLSIGDVLDRALAVYKRHFKVLFVVMAAFEIPLLAIARPFEATVRGVMASGAIGRPEAMAKLLPSLGAWYATFLFGAYVIQQAATSSLAAAAAPALFGRPGEVTLGAAGRDVARRMPAILTSAIAQAVALALFVGLGMLPGVLLLWRGESLATKVIGGVGMMVGAALGLVVAAVRYALAPAAAGVEGAPAWRALSRSVKLMKARPGAPFLERPAIRASIVLFTAFAIALAANGVVALPGGVADALLGRSWLSGAGAARPLWLEIAVAIFEGAASAALQPFSLLVLAVFYFDRRARREGFDLELWADGLAAAAPGTRP